MAQDPRALLQQVPTTPNLNIARTTLNCFLTGRQSGPKRWRGLQPIWWQDRKVRKSSRTIYTSCKCLSSAKARCRIPLKPSFNPVFFLSAATRQYTLKSFQHLNYLGKEAGLAFERAASIQTKNLNEPDDAANSLTEAYKSYRKSDPEDAARVLQQAINHYISKGNFRRAATHQQNLAEIYEIELGDEKRAAEAYETAAGWFESDHAEAYVLK